MATVNVQNGKSQIQNPHLRNVDCQYISHPKIHLRVEILMLLYTIFFLPVLLLEISKEISCINRMDLC
jgi:hypothetical protein